NLFYQFNSSSNEQWFLSNDSKVVVEKSKGWYCYNQSDGLIDAPTKLFMAKNDVVWASGSHKSTAAVCYLQNNKWKKILLDSLAKDVETRSVFVDKDGAIYVGGKSGLHINGGMVKIKYNTLEKIIVTHYTEDLPESVTSGIKRDKNGDLLIINQGESTVLNKAGIANQVFGVFTGKSSATATSPNKNIWIGTEDQGVYCWNGDSSKQYNTSNGLQSNVVTNICFDSDSTFWLATEKDITRFDGTTWINNVFNQEFIIEKEAGDLKPGNSGELWINMVPRKWIMRGQYPDMDYDFSDGFYAVKFKPDTALPRCKIGFYTSVVDPVGNTHISWDGIDYMHETKKENILFSYKLNDNQWTPFSKELDHTFLSLERGDYILQLKAKDRFGNDSDKSDRIKFKVLPPVYLRAWFLIMVSLFVVTIIYLIVRILLKNKTLHLFNVDLQEQKEEIMSQNEEIQQQSEEIVAQRDTLEEKNLEITEQKEKLAKSYGRLELLSNFGRKITSSLDVDSINSMMYQYVYSEIDFNAFGIGIFIPEREEIIFPSFIEGKNKPKVLRKPLNDANSLVNWCFINQKSMFINDVETEYVNYVKALNRPNTSVLAQSRIHIPLTVSGKKLGIFVINSFNKNAYTEDDFESLKTLASYISIALDNANAYEVIKSINHAFLESISYAKSIQSAFLPTQGQLGQYFSSFQIFKPKDIVSGDFYWFYPVEPNADKPLKAFIAVADCTGHGVPGALISSIGNNLLKESIKIRKNQDPSIILTELNDDFQETLKQEETNNNDGMDMALILLEEDSSFDQPALTTDQAGFEVSSLKLNKQESLIKNQQSETRNKKPETRNEKPQTRNKKPETRNQKRETKNFKITFSGAKNPLVIYRAQTGELECIKGSRKSIGG
ncbi:MAG: GAF domain-containing protein, partial [Bacteroidales bacterium]|nr:GAF domain-containing protein [Bacteroidales bacterium]